MPDPILNKWISTISQGTGEALEGVPVCEEFGSRDETFGATSFEAQVTLRVPWVKRFEVFWDIYQNNVPYPDAPKCFFSSCSIAPDMQAPKVSVPPSTIPPGADGVIPYADALIQMKYSTDEAEAQSLYVQTFEPAVDFRVIDKTGFYWGTASDQKSEVKDKEAPGLQHTMYNYTVRWLQQEKVPIAALNLAGTVNNAAYQISKIMGTATWKVEAESMLYQLGPINKSVWLELQRPGPTPAASKVPKPGWDYTLKFIINTAYNGTSNMGIWNKFFNAKVTPMPAVDHEYDWYDTMWRAKTGAAGEAFKPYPVKLFPVDDETATGIHFLPKEVIPPPPPPPGIPAPPPPALIPRNAR